MHHFSSDEMDDSDLRRLRFLLFGLFFLLPNLSASLLNCFFFSLKNNTSSNEGKHVNNGLSAWLQKTAAYRCRFSS